MNEFIDLSLQKLNNKNEVKYFINQVIVPDEISVILGTPGSGKTSLLRKLENTKKNSKFYKIRTFLKTDIAEDSNYEVFMLDGLDEFRSITTDKSSVIEDLALKINSLKKWKSIIIACREMDWYGDIDSSSLHDVLSSNVSLYKILPLSLKQKIELAKLQGIKNINDFLDKYNKFNLINNPQMFVMLSNEYSNEQSFFSKTKRDVFSSFIKNAKEKNPSYTMNELHSLSPDLRMKIIGYIACFYIFCDVDFFSDEIIDEISQNNEYCKKNILSVLDSPIFDSKIFIHRTIAEFACADFFVNLFDLKKNNSFIDKVKSIFVYNHKIPTELRGVYAWICSLTGVEELISEDPYYQLLYGDASLFPNELKRIILDEISFLAKENPYFIDHDHNLPIEGFYSENLDSVFIKILHDNQNSHLSLVVLNILTGDKDGLSRNISQELKKLVFDGEFKYYLKRNILKIFDNDEDLFLSVLKGIKDKEVVDSEDILKEYILNTLYPDTINYNEIADYLILYSKDTIGHGWFLLSTPYEKQKNIVDRIYQLSFDPYGKEKLRLPKVSIAFIENFFAETINRYKTPLTAQEIYDIFMHFKEQYYEEYQKIQPRSFDRKVHDEIDTLSLSNELFEIFVKEHVKKGLPVGNWLYSFFFLFNFINPNNQIEVLLENINKDNEQGVNAELFTHAFRFRDRNKSLEVFDKIAEKFNLVDIYNDLKNKKIDEWQIDQEKLEKEQKEKKENIRRENEKYFNKPEDVLLNDFNVLISGAEQLLNNYYEGEYENLTEQTVAKITNILKTFLFTKKLNREFLTLQSIGNSKKGIFRGIDIVYYVATQLNKGEEIIQRLKSDIPFLKYLYINSIIHSNFLNIIAGDFVSTIEESKNIFAFMTLKEYCSILLKRNYTSALARRLYTYINKCVSLTSLKNIAKINVMDNETEPDIILMKSLLSEFGFDLSLEDLEELKKETFSEEIQDTIEAILIIENNDRNSFNKKHAVSIYKILRGDKLVINNIQKDRFIRIVTLLMDQFCRYEDIQSVNGFQTFANQCASFLKREVYGYLNVEELHILKGKRGNNKDIWIKYINNYIHEKLQISADTENNAYPINQFKDFLFKEKLLTKQEFNCFVVKKVHSLLLEIEQNRDNEKDAFFSITGNGEKGKKEESCRDIIMLRLKDRYDSNWFITKEKNEENYRVDINIKDRANEKYEMQIECKKDNNNGELYSGINNQLIDKYIRNSNIFGIYLVFYFGHKNDKERMLNKIENQINDQFKSRVTVLCLDLT